jgi:hypothetical protein
MLSTLRSAHMRGGISAEKEKEKEKERGKGKPARVASETVAEKGSATAGEKGEDK